MVALTAVFWTPAARSAHALGARTGELRAALAAWADFPVNARVRPLVLTSDPVTAPAQGFPTDDSKEAFLAGRFVAPTTSPPGPQRTDGYPVIRSADALALMQAEGTPGPGHPAPLLITTVSFGAASFATDRGTRVLPAWLFSFEGVMNPAAVLAVAASSRFPAPTGSLDRSSIGARLARNGRTLTIRFAGAASGSGPCTADYAVDQLASKTAVAVSVRETRHPTGTCADVGYARRHRIQLASPLGNRVLVDAGSKAPVATAL